MLSRTARLATVTLLAQGLALIAKPPAAAAAVPKRYNCGDPTGWCCISDGDCPAGVFCCYFKNGDLQTETCGCEGAS